MKSGKAEGTPFYDSSCNDGLSITVGIGPSRSGKTFFENAIASHFVRQGGAYRAIDIDPGSENLARFLGKDCSALRDRR